MCRASLKVGFRVDWAWVTLEAVEADKSTILEFAIACVKTLCICRMLEGWSWCEVSKSLVLILGST